LFHFDLNKLLSKDSKLMNDSRVNLVIRFMSSNSAYGIKEKVSYEKQVKIVSKEIEDSSNTRND